MTLTLHVGAASATGTAAFGMGMRAAVGALVASKNSEANVGDLEGFEIRKRIQRTATKVISWKSSTQNRR
jgi:hypothetical protein